MTDEEKRLAHIEQVRKVGKANKGRPRPDIAQSNKDLRKPLQESKAKTEQIKIDKLIKPSYTNPILLAYRIAKYFHFMDSIDWENTTGKHTGKPYTDTGIDLAMGVVRTTADQMLKGSLDFIITDRENGIERVSREGIQKKYLKDIEPEILPYVLHLLGNSDYAFDKAPLTLDKETLEQMQEWGMGVYFSEIVLTARQLTANQREYRLYDNGRTADIFALKSRDEWKDDTVIVNRREMVNSAEARELLEKILELPQIEG